MKRNIERLTFFVLGAVFVVVGYLIGEFDPKADAKDGVFDKFDHIWCKSLTVSGGSLILFSEGEKSDSASIQLGFEKDSKPYFTLRDDNRDTDVSKRDAGIAMGFDEHDGAYLNVFYQNIHKQKQYVEMNAGPITGARLRAFNAMMPIDAAVIDLICRGTGGKIALTSPDRDQLKPAIELSTYPTSSFISIEGEVINHRKR